jgi:ABC-type antimicrobial peptide transport system permease subunit
MFWNYVKLSFRKFIRQKFYSLLNIFGLATGMATVILIMLYVLDELSYDKFHTYEKDLYRVVENQYYSGQPVFPVAVTPGPLADGLAAGFPEVKKATRLHYGWNAFQYEEARFDARGAYVDDEFLAMFDFPLLNGDTSTVLDEVNSVVLTEELASKLFGNEDPMGKTVRVNRERAVLVTGILRDLPHSSHMQFDYIMPMSRRIVEMPFLKDEWDSNTLYTYVQLVPGVSVFDLNEKIRKFLSKKVEGSVTELYLQPIADVHLGEVNFVADSGRTGNKQYVRIFSIVAIFILIIACINFMNLATARAMKRAKEVGLRKTIGAYRHQLIVQFLGESVMVAFVALCIALLFVDLLLLPFNTLTQKTLEIDYTNFTTGILPGCLIATILTGLFAGSYPAFFLSAFQPAHVLKGTTARAAGGTFRKILVVTQFSISIVMISGTLVIYSQMEFIRNINLGWERHDMLMIPNVQNYGTLKVRLLNHSQIEGVSATNQHPAYVQNSTSGIGWKGKNEDDVILFHLQGVDVDYIETMKIGLLAGRTFSKSSPKDTLSTIINEEAVKVLGFKDPIGEYLTAGDEAFEIIGVVKNFHFKSIHDKIEPLLLYLERGDMSNMMVRIKGDTKDAVDNIEKEWKTVNPDLLFSYSFLNEDFHNLYRAESQTGTIFQYFSVLAIVISCLGLFGLAAYTTEQRSKEYGIRKVFGASAARLFYHASIEFLILVVLAFFISVPIGWYWMREWLQGFAYHIELSWLVFVTSGLFAVFIAFLTVSYHAGRVGFINPAKTLRAE